jgi:Ser/Thr protein kinase RdoA (MazF antagonist)
MNSKPQKSFYELTPERILDAVEQAGVRCTGRFSALNSMENRVYEVEVECDLDQIKSPSEKFRVIKFYRPNRWSFEQIAEEHFFLESLIDNDLSVVPPIVLEDDHTVGIENDSGIMFTVFPKAGGRSIDELSKDNARMLGRLIARMHRVGDTIDDNQRIHLTADTYGRQALELLQREQLIPEDLAAVFSDVIHKICDLADQFAKDVPTSLIHGDCHLSNILWAKEVPTFVDFDDMVIGPAIQDLWLLLPGRDSHAREILDEVLAGYQLFRDLPLGPSLKLVECLRALRMIHYSAWIGKRREDPAFKRNFPHFGTIEYWRNLYSDLNQQYIVISQSQYHPDINWPYDQELNHY